MNLAKVRGLLDRLVQPNGCAAKYGSAMLNPGDKAPDFTLLDQNGEPFSLSKSLKARKVRHFVYFYPS